MNTYIFAGLLALAAVLIGFETQSKHVDPIRHVNPNITSSNEPIAKLKCISLVKWAQVIEEYGGFRLSIGNIGESGIVSVWGFNDGTFGVFLLRINENYKTAEVCSISVGLFPAFGIPA